MMLLYQDAFLQDNPERDLWVCQRPKINMATEQSQSSEHTAQLSVDKLETPV
jgi:hypothetical protein